MRGVERIQVIEILQQRLCQLAEKRTSNSLFQFLKKHPEFLDGIRRHLAGKGIVLKASKLFKEKAPNEVTKIWIPYCYRTLDKTRPPILQKLLTALDGIAFSQCALHALKSVTTSAHHYKAKLLEILEYGTGFDVSMRLTGDLRHLPTLTSYLQEMRNQRGCRGALLRLPPKWDSSCDGIFTKKEIVGSQILLVNRFTDACHLLSESLILCHFGPGIGFSDLHIINNFSEVRASVRSDQTATMITIATLPVADGDGNPQDNALKLNIEATPWPARVR